MKNFLVAAIFLATLSFQVEATAQTSSEGHTVSSKKSHSKGSHKKVKKSKKRNYKK